MKSAEANSTVRGACPPQAGEVRQAHRFRSFWFPVLAASCLALYGCQIQWLDYERLSAIYDQTQVDASSTLDVLGMLRSPEYGLGPGFAGTHLLSQSDTIIASTAQTKDADKTWFNLVVFDERTMTAKRKYFFLIDEKARLACTKPKRYLIVPRRGLKFDSQMALQAEVLDKPYATEEARRIAILRQVAENFSKDIDELRQNTGEPGQGNEMLDVSAMLMNQAFETLLLELARSPALAAKLSTESGVPFDHINFDKGAIRMLVEDSIVTVKIRLGAFRLEAKE
jgi:hypothetical protein